MTQGKRKPERRPVALHPLLFAVAPILFLYSYNAPRLPIAPAELLLPLALSFIAALVLWLFLWLVLNSSRRAALVVSLFLALFFTYGRVLDVIGTTIPPGLLPYIAGGILLLGILFFGLPREDVHFFTQQMMPALDFEFRLVEGVLQP